MFPGCLVGLRGINGGGKLFAVKEVLMVSISLLLSCLYTLEAVRPTLDHVDF